MAHESTPSNPADYVVPLQIGGKEVHSSIPPFAVNSPSSNTACWHFSPSGVHEAEEAASAAQAAFASWSQTKPTTRRDILLRAANIMEQRAEEFGSWMQIETGAEPSFSTNFNLPVCVSQLRDVAGRLITAIGGTVNVCENEGRYAMVLKEPYGVILGIAPWNAPYILGVRSVAYALAAGNTCVLKGSENSPRCFWAIGQAFKDAGLPDGCLNVISVRPQDAAEVTAALIAHPAVKKVNFTGSTAVGASIASVCGRNLKPCLMELGGKNCSLVMADADLEEAAKWCALGAFHHSGQICMCTDLVLVEESIFASFVEVFRKTTAAMYSARAPVLINAGGVAKNKSLVADAVAKGAKVVYQNEAAEQTSTQTGPTIINNLTKEMNMYHTEAFGPTVGVVPISTDDEGIQIANETGYGLSAAIFSRDLARALRMARRITSGAVHINSMTIHDEPNLPHGGVKNSGWGRFNATQGIEEFLLCKTITWGEAISP